MFTPDDREQVQRRVLEWADSDPRIVAAAIVGSMAHRPGDRWSDLDLTFAVDDRVPVGDVLEEWSRRVATEFDGVSLFDLSSGGATYRVFLLPGCLQFDLSFSAAAVFGAMGPDFRLVFGTAVEKPFVAPPPARELFGYAVHHAVRARICIERGRFWQAEYWISGVRDNALALACRRRGLAAYFGRGVDELPIDVRGRFAECLVRSLNREELLRAAAATVDRLFEESGEAGELPVKVERWMRDLVAADPAADSESP